MARGAYRPKSKLIAHTQPFSYNEYQLYKGRNFYYINEGAVIESFYSIREKNGTGYLWFLYFRTCE